MIQKATGGLPFAIALGDDEDGDTVLVALNQATDDELRFYLAFNELCAMVRALLQPLVDEVEKQKQRHEAVEP